MSTLQTFHLFHKGNNLMKYLHSQLAAISKNTAEFLRRAALRCWWCEQKSISPYKYHKKLLLLFNALRCLQCERTTAGVRRISDGVVDVRART